jgi:hypothetical protein
VRGSDSWYISCRSSAPSSPDRKACRLGEEEADWGRRKQIGGGGRGLGSGGKKEKGEGGETEGRWERKREDHFEELPRLLLGLA